MLRALCLVLMLLTSSAALAQVDVKVTLTPAVTPFHKQATFTVVVEAPAGTEIKLPDMRDHFGKLKVYGIPDHHSEPLGEDRIRVTERYVLDPLKIRDHYIPPVVVTWGEGQSMAVPSPMFSVRDLTPEEVELAEQFAGDIAGGPGEGGGGRTALWTLLAVGAIAIAVAAALLFYFRDRTTVPVEKIRKEAWEIAKERLVALAERQLPQQGKYDAYHVDLSSILRYYIEARFEVHAPERTTPEFLQEITGEGFFTPEQEVFLARFLRLCDRVKFAQFRPDLEAMSISYEEVERFVEETIPVLAPETEEAKAA